MICQIFKIILKFSSHLTQKYSILINIKFHKCNQFYYIPIYKSLDKMTYEWFKNTCHIDFLLNILFDHFSLNERFIIWF